MFNFLQLKITISMFYLTIKKKQQNQQQNILQLSS